MPAVELIYLDSLAVHLMGAAAPVPPYTLEHGTAVASLLLRAVTDSPAVELEPEDDETPPVVAAAREAVVDGAHRLASRGGHGVNQLVTRFVGAAAGELERLKEDAEAQVRSLFCYGMLAIASGPENQASGETADGVLAAFHVWDARIAAGFVPPWRVVAPAPQ